MKKEIVYIVAGLSSRFGGKVKQLVEVGENRETFMEISMYQAIKAGFDRIVLVVGKKTESAFREKFGSSYNGVPIEYAYQEFDERKRDKPWGTTDALCSAREIIKFPFVICNGDDLYGEKSFKILANHLDTSQEDATVGYRLRNVLPISGETNRGIFQLNDEYVSDITEIIGVSRTNFSEKNLTEKSLCSMNLFALHPATLTYLGAKLLEFKTKNDGERTLEAFLPQNLSDLIKQNKIKIRAYSTDDNWIGITNPGDELAVREFLKRNN